MILTILGLIDVALGGVLAASPYFSYAGMAIIGTLAIIALVKGVYSVLAGVAAEFYFDLLGWLDLIVAVLLFLTTLGIHFNWFLWIGIFMAAKGVYSIVTEMIGD
jgi:hypothetical protein